MLTSLHIEDFVLIEHASLSLSPGMTVLTGETGAGKSILLDALGLAVGGRSERASVRRGAERGVVTAAFEPGADHPVWALLKEHDLDDGEDQVILRRVQSNGGKSRGLINDRPVSIGLLRDIGDCLMEIHGQHDGRGFLTTSTHRILLDEFGGLAHDAAQVRKAWTEYSRADKELAARRDGRRKAAAEADYFRFIVDELENLAPGTGEEAKLSDRRAHLMATERAKEDVGTALAAFGDDGVDEKLGFVARKMTRGTAGLTDEQHPLSRAAAACEAALEAASEARAALEEAAFSVDVHTDELEAVEERLFALRAAARKHGVQVDQLADVLEEKKHALQLLDDGEAGFSKLERTVATSKAAFGNAAKKLSADRHASAVKLDQAVMAELAPLKLGKAVFTTVVAPDEATAGPDGVDHVEFMVATNPGAPAGALRTIASGGELSRFVLAMKAALSVRESRTVIIFDEIDAGVGGAVADAVGERLARLARDAQVLVVTHSPQVAARADWHWRIEKEQSNKATRTQISVLDEKARLEEIARMLSGAEITDEARAAAASLLRGERTTSSKGRRKRKVV